MVKGKRRAEDPGVVVIRRIASRIVYTPSSASTMGSRPRIAVRSTIVANGRTMQDWVEWFSGV